MQWKRMMKWVVATAVLLVTALGAVAPQEAQAAAAYYVSQNGNDSWSGTLSAPNGSGTDGPFKTLGRARDAMRSGSIKTTYIRGGTYYMDSPLVLTAADSGTKYRAYGTETAILSGGQKVTGFMAEGNGIYSAPLSTPSDMELIFDGVRQRIAEKKAYDAANPFTYGHYFTSSVEANTEKNKIRVTAGELTAADAVPHLKVESFASNRLVNDIQNVTNVDLGTNVLTLAGNNQYAVSIFGTYRLLNNPAYLDETGEFAYRADGRILFKPADSAKLLSQGVVIPRRTILVLDGASNVVVQRLSFQDTPYMSPAIELKNGANGNGFYNNKFLNVGKGLFLNGSSNNTINHNEMAQIGNAGVELAYNSNYNAVNWNYMHHISLVKKNGGGVMAYGVHYNRINHNRIEYTARYGISIKRWNADTIHTNNIVEYNKILHTNLETQDSGAIEMLGRGANDTATKVRYNYIEHTGGLMTNGELMRFEFPTGTDGIYLDDETSGVEVFGNFIKDTSRTSIFIHAGDNNVIRNNVGIIGNTSWKSLKHEDGKEKFVRLEWGTTKRVSSNTAIDRNIIYSKTPNWAKYLDYFTGGTYTSDNNILHQVPKYAAQDANSIIADPLFVNPSSGNYRLQSGSPAFSKGFVELPWVEWGKVQSVAGVQPPEYVFYKGINLNGGAVTVEGNSWTAHSTALTQGLSIPSGSSSYSMNPELTVAPAADPAVKTMLNTGLWRNDASLSISQTLPNNKYQVYIWVLENHQDNYRSFNLTLEGTAVDTNIGTMVKNNWVKYGPYDANVTDGVLNMELVAGTQDPQISGFAIYRKQ